LVNTAVPLLLSKKLQRLDRALLDDCFYHGLLGIHKARFLKEEAGVTDSQIWDVLGKIAILITIIAETIRGYLALRRLHVSPIWRQRAVLGAYASLIGMFVTFASAGSREFIIGGGWSNLLLSYAFDFFLFVGLAALGTYVICRLTENSATTRASLRPNLH
jgi:hypothetical protein